MACLNTVVREFPHAPGASLDYGLNWGTWLATGDTLTGSLWEVDSADITLANDQIVGAVTQIIATGGVVGQMYRLTNTITTSSFKTDSRQLVLICKER